MSSTEAACTSKRKTQQNSTTYKKRDQTLYSLWRQSPKHLPLTPIENLSDKRKRSIKETPKNPLPDQKKVRRGLFNPADLLEKSQSPQLNISPESLSGLNTDLEDPVPIENINSSFSSEGNLKISPRAFPTGSNLSTTKLISKYKIVTPQSLPDSIPKHRRNEYIQTIAERQIDPWSFEKNLETLDLRSSLLSSNFSSDYVLLSGLLQKVSQALKKNGVKTIDSVHFPDIHIDSCEQLLEVLQGFLGQDDTDIPYVTAIHICIDVPKLTTIRGKSDDFTKLFVARNVEKVHVLSNNDTLNAFFQNIERKTSSLANFVCEIQCPTLSPQVLQRSTQVHQQYTLPFSSVVQRSPRSSSDTGSIVLPNANGEGENHHLLTHDFKITLSHEYSNYGLDPLTEQLGLTRFRESNIDGRGIHIAFLTSGILSHHLAFRNAIDEMQSFVPSEESDLTVDELGYGTACASIAGGRSFDYPNAHSPKSDLELQCLKFPPGVAPGAKLTILEVTSAASSQADPASIINALDYVRYIHENGKAVNIVCIPMGSTSYNREIQSKLSALQCLGIIIICAAGNTARNGIAYPAHHGGALCIGACDVNGARIASTPIGQELDFLAPGVSVRCAGTSTAGLWEVSYVNGSSGACAAVAGVVAVVLQYIRDVEETRDLFEKIDTHVIKELLKIASTHQTHHSEKDGYGSLDLNRFLAARPQEIRQKILKIISPD